MNSTLRCLPPFARRLMAVASLAALLGACNDPPASENVMSLAPHRAVSQSFAAVMPERPHDRPADGPEVLAIRIGPGFGLGERAKILRAVNEWNHALNGAVRLEIVPEPGDAAPTLAANSRSAKRWMIAAISGATDPRHLPAGSHALAATQAIPGGGVVVVNVDRVRENDLEGVLRHEIGHMLGLGHEGESRLMSPFYRAYDQRCIDKGTLAALAAQRHLPLSSLHWCEG